MVMGITIHSRKTCCKYTVFHLQKLAVGQIIVRTLRPIKSAETVMLCLGMIDYFFVI